MLRGDEPLTGLETFPHLPACPVRDVGKRLKLPGRRENPERNVLLTGGDQHRDAASRRGAARQHVLEHIVEHAQKPQRLARSSALRRAAWQQALGVEDEIVDEPFAGPPLAERETAMEGDQQRSARSREQPGKGRGEGVFGEHGAQLGEFPEPQIGRGDGVDQPIDDRRRRIAKSRPQPGPQLQDRRQFAVKQEAARHARSGREKLHCGEELPTELLFGDGFHEQAPRDAPLPVRKLQLQLQLEACEFAPLLDLRCRFVERLAERAQGATEQATHRFAHRFRLPHLRIFGDGAAVETERRADHPLAGQDELRHEDLEAVRMGAGKQRRHQVRSPYLGHHEQAQRHEGPIERNFLLEDVLAFRALADAAVQAEAEAECGREFAWQPLDELCGFRKPHPGLEPGKRGIEIEPARIGFHLQPAVIGEILADAGLECRGFGRGHALEQGSEACVDKGEIGGKRLCQSAHAPLRLLEARAESLRVDPGRCEQGRELGVVGIDGDGPARCGRRRIEMLAKTRDHLGREAGAGKTHIVACGLEQRGEQQRPIAAVAGTRGEGSGSEPQRAAVGKKRDLVADEAEGRGNVAAKPPCERRRIEGAPIEPFAIEAHGPEEGCELACARVVPESRRGVRERRRLAPDKQDRQQEMSEPAQRSRVHDAPARMPASRGTISLVAMLRQSYQLLDDETPWRKPPRAWSPWARVTLSPADGRARACDAGDGRRRKLVLPSGLEPPTPSLPRTCSTD